jgi:signal transduction histidine kinase
MSLRASIVALGVGAATAVLVLLAAPVAISTVEAARDEAEQEATTLVQGIADVAGSGTGTLELVVERANDRRDDTPVTILLPDGTALGEADQDCGPVRGAGDSTAGPDGRRGDGGGGADDLEELLPVSETDVVDVEGGRSVRVAAATAEGDAVVCAFVEDDEVLGEVAGRLGWLAVAALAVLALVTAAALLLARRLARPLEAATATADRLALGDLRARVSVTGPTEVRRVGSALNRLAGRIDELLTLERETAADLSHRLRTPLMTVRLDVDSLPASPAKDELDTHLDDLERTLTAVIAAARRPQREGAAPSCDAVDVTRERLEFWAPLLEDQGRKTSLVIDVAPGDGPVRCAAGDLAATLDALLENVVAHTAEGVAVEVAVSSVGGGQVHLDVRDRGPGVPAEALQRGRSDRGSTGLGLDIARSCAEATGGRLELVRIDEWAVVRLVLGSADSQVDLTST